MRVTVTVIVSLVMTTDTKSKPATLTLEQKALLYAEMTNSVAPDDFGLTLEGRFLPKWLKDAGVLGQFTYETARGTLDRKVVHKMMAGMTIDEMSSLTGRAKPALTELEELKAKWDERSTATNSTDSGGSSSPNKDEALDDPNLGTPGEDRPQTGKQMALPKGRAGSNGGRTKGGKGGAK